MHNLTLDLKTYIKPTNTFHYFERSSTHYALVFKGFIKGETNLCTCICGMRATLLYQKKS